MKNKHVIPLFAAFALALNTHASGYYEQVNTRAQEPMCITASPVSLSEVNSTGDEKPKHFILTLNDGSHISFLLNEKPVVQNKQDNITVVYQDYIIDYPLNDIHKYTMGTDYESEITSGIKTQSSETGGISLKNNYIELSDFTPGSQVLVTDINGITYLNSVISTNGVLLINLSDFHTGMYIIKANNKTFKFVKR